MDVPDMDKTINYNRVICNNCKCLTLTGNCGWVEMFKVQLELSKHFSELNPIKIDGFIDIYLL